MGADDCIFCKIADGRIKSELVYEDDTCVAFNDLSPQAPTHILVIPRRHIASLAEATPDDEATLGRVLGAAGEIAREKGFADAGYRVVLNTNDDGGQTVFHLHAHLLAGRQFIFPPG